MNSLDLIIEEKKLKAINLINYSITLKDLKHYFNLTSYLWNYVFFYAQLTKFLQEFKTRLLKFASIQKLLKRTYTFRHRLKHSIDREMTSFNDLQKTLFNVNMLIHFNLKRVLWIDLNAFKKFEFEVVTFYIKNITKTFTTLIVIKNSSVKSWSLRISMKLIIFLSRLLIDAKRNYWLTKLKIADFV